MTQLFTEKDVMHLRRLGWPHRSVTNPKFNGVATADEELLSALENLDEEYAASQGSDDSFRGVEETRQSAKHFKGLNKALAKFDDYDDLVLDLYEPDLSLARSAIERMMARAEEFAKILKGKHESKSNGPKDVDKQMIELWALSSGEPPTRGKGTRKNDGHKIYPAGKCFKYLLDKLTEFYGGSISEEGFQNLLKEGRTKYNSKSGI